MRYFPLLWLACTSTFLTGCISNPPALSDVPAEHRRHIQVVQQTDNPSVRYRSAGARTARRIGASAGLGLAGALVGTSVGAAMDFSPDHLAKIRSENGNFETDMLRRQFQTVLSNALAQAAATNGATALDPKPSRAEFRVISFGLYEIEKKRFSPYAHAKAKLTTASGKQVWSEQAYSVGLQVRPLEDYLRDAKLYRTDFEEIAADLAAQLVHGPIRNPPEL